jgi:hypothetical protein
LAAYSAEAVITVNNRQVRANTEIGSDSPQALSLAIQSNIKKQGWHDIIYNHDAPDQAFLYFTQKTSAGADLELKVTFWKAVKNGERTEICTWVTNVKAGEVNRFLDEEFARVAMQFKVAKS